MVIFNHTFSSDKPIYFPENWQSGKTQVELYEQWKTTTQFWIYSNILQTFISSLFIFIIVIIFIALKEVKRIYNLNDNDHQKMQHRKYFAPSFLIPLAFLGIMCLTFFVFLLFEQWTRNALLKGFCCCIISYSTYNVYNFLTPVFKKWKKQLKIGKNNNFQANKK